MAHLKGVEAARKPAARKKANDSLQQLISARHDLARRYKLSPLDFSKNKLLDTLARINVHPSKVPLVVLRPLGKAAVRSLLNGAKHDAAGGGTSIPLDAIPERAKPNGNGERKTYTKRTGHPNAQLIEKVLDQIAAQGTNDKIASRLLTVLDKLIA